MSSKRAEQDFELLRTYIQREKRLHCAYYKDSFLRRRFAVRMYARGVDNHADYQALLRSDPAEFEALLTALTVNHSYFMRDRAAFELLRTQVLAPLIAKRQQNQNRTLKIWSAGCASGEEPYSVAILLLELLGAKFSRWQLRIDGTDVSEATLEQARRGLYDERVFQDVSADFSKRYFQLQNKKYQLLPEICEMVLFRQHDIKDTPLLPNYDLILCRNVLIYFTRERQTMLVQQLLEHLAPGGYLMLGMVEMLPPSLAKFVEPVCGDLRIYLRNNEEISL